MLTRRRHRSELRQRRLVDNAAQSQLAFLLSALATVTVAGCKRASVQDGPSTAPPTGISSEASAGRTTPTPTAGGVGGSVASGHAGAPRVAGEGGTVTNAGAGRVATQMPPPNTGRDGMDGGAPDGGPSHGDAGSSPVDDDCTIGVFDGKPAVPLTISGDTAAHDPTMIEADGAYYRFWTGDRIPVASSTDLKLWRDIQPVYRNGYPQWSKDWLAGVPGQTFNFPWAPDVSQFGGAYHVYAAFSAKFGDNVSCITHLTTSDIRAGEWTDRGPVICTKGSENYNAIDPDVGLDVDGVPYLAFGSFWDGIFAFKLKLNGERDGNGLTRLASAPQVEAPVLFYRCGFYYLFVSFGLCCPGNGRTVEQLTYRVAVGRSKSIMGPYVDRRGVSMLDGGGTVVVQGDATFAAAGHSDVIRTGAHFYQLYHAYRRPSGRSELRVVEMLFDNEGWPVPSGP